MCIMLIYSFDNDRYLSISKRPEWVYEIKECEGHGEHAQEHVGHSQVHDQYVLGYPQQLKITKYNILFNSSQKQCKIESWLYIMSRDALFGRQYYWEQHIGPFLPKIPIVLLLLLLGLLSILVLVLFCYCWF